MRGFSPEPHHADARRLISPDFAVGRLAVAVNSGAGRQQGMAAADDCRPGRAGATIGV